MTLSERLDSLFFGGLKASIARCAPHASKPTTVCADARALVPPFHHIACAHVMTVGLQVAQCQHVHSHVCHVQHCCTTMCLRNAESGMTKVSHYLYKGEKWAAITCMMVSGPIIGGYAAVPVLGGAQISQMLDRAGRLRRSAVSHVAEQRGVADVARRRQAAASGAVQSWHLYLPLQLSNGMGIVADGNCLAPYAGSCALPGSVLLVPLQAASSDCAYAGRHLLYQMRTRRSCLRSQRLAWAFLASGLVSSCRRRA